MAMLRHLTRPWTVWRARDGDAAVYGRPQAAAAEEELARGMWAPMRQPLRWFTWLGWAQRIGARVGWVRLLFRGRMS